MHDNNNHIDNLFKQGLSESTIQKDAKNEWAKIAFRVRANNFLHYSPLGFNIYNSLIGLVSVSATVFILNTYSPEKPKLRPNENDSIQLLNQDSTTTPPTIETIEQKTVKKELRSNKKSFSDTLKTACDTSINLHDTAIDTLVKDVPQDSLLEASKSLKKLVVKKKVQVQKTIIYKEEN